MLLHRYQISPLYSMKRVGSLPAPGLFSRSRRLYESKVRSLVGQQSSGVVLSIWTPKLNSQSSFKSVTTCEYLHCGHPSCTGRNTPLPNQHFLQGKRGSIRRPHPTGSLNVQIPVICSQRDCSLGLRIPPDARR